jgi:predicted GIY-YIG superfamily endonuclease
MRMTKLPKGPTAATAANDNEKGKVCPKCGAWKPLDDYHNSSTKKSGRVSRCKICVAETKKTRRVAAAVNRKPRALKWTDAKIAEEALKYRTRTDLQNGNLAAYTAARRSKKGIDYFCQHMTFANESWTFEKLLERALRYSTIKEFSEGDYAAYSAGLRSGRKSELHAHMERKVQPVPRYVYLIASNDNHTVYVGLSDNPERRYAEHRSAGKKSVRDLISGPHKFTIIDGPMPEDAAASLEKKTVKEFISGDFNVLNSVSGGALGSLGSTVKWTCETIREEALKYNSVAEWNQLSSGSYSAALKYHGGSAQFTGHMKKLRYWDAKSIHEEALKYSLRSHFEKACGSAVLAAKRLGIWDEVCAHMEWRGTTPKKEAA